MPAVSAMQVLRLCWRYGLLTALTYILNRGLNDYMGPAAHLLMALLMPSAHGPGNDSKAAGYRLLVYLRCCLTGCSFPPGAQEMLNFNVIPSNAAKPSHCSAVPIQPAISADVHTCICMLQRDSAYGWQILLRRAEYKAEGPQLCITYAAGTLQANQLDAWQRQSIVAILCVCG